MLLTASILDRQPSCQALLTHGFVVDREGKKSESKGTVVAPQKVPDALGAAILRLWAAATDSGELSIWDEALKRVVEAYRRIRKPSRLLLANTSDFDPKKDALPVEDLFEIDRYAIARIAQLQTEFLQQVERFEFHPVVSKLEMYCWEDLGGFYLDILNDRLHTSGVNSKARRSAQTALYYRLRCCA